MRSHVRRIMTYSRWSQLCDFHLCDYNYATQGRLFLKGIMCVLDVTSPKETVYPMKKLFLSLLAKKEDYFDRPNK